VPPKFQQNFFEDHEEQEFLDDDYQRNEEDWANGRDEQPQPVYRQVLDTANLSAAGGLSRHGWLENKLSQADDSGPKYQPNQRPPPNQRAVWQNQPLAGYSQPEFGWRPAENNLEPRDRHLPSQMREPLPNSTVRSKNPYSEPSEHLAPHQRLDTDGKYLVKQGN
jgi:hypothetical protein